VLLLKLFQRSHHLGMQDRAELGLLLEQLEWLADLVAHRLDRLLQRLNHGSKLGHDYLRCAVDASGMPGSRTGA
jgi:hypothetical protein